MMSNYNDRYVRQARGNDAWAAHIAQVYGHRPAQVRQLLDIASRLQQPSGHKLDDHDATVIKQCFAAVPAYQIDDLIRGLNAEPAHTRADLYVGLLTGDINAVHGDFHMAGDRYRHVRELANQNTVASYADELNRRRGGSEDASPAWRPEPGSTRAIIEHAMEGPERREFKQRLEADDPVALEASRHAVAAGIEQSSEWLARGEGSLHDSVAAAFDLHQGAGLAESEFGIEGDV